MKALVIALSLLAGQAWGAVAANTVALWTLQNSLADTSGNGYDLAGSAAAYSNSLSCVQTYSLGPLGSNKRQGNSSVATAMAADDSWTVEGYIYPTSTGTQFFWCWGDGLGNFGGVNIVAGKVKYVRNDADKIVSVASVSANTCYYVAVVASSSSAVALYLSPANSISQTADNTVSEANAGVWNTGGTFTVGDLGFLPNVVPYTGYISGVRVSNVARTSFPTADPTAFISVNSPYMKQWQGIFVTPKW
jgi:hypothetical protein